MDNAVLWSGTVLSKSLEDRLVAADAGGFSEVSLFPTDVVDYEEDVGEYPDIASLDAAYDASFTILDPYIQWLPTDLRAIADFEGGEWYDFTEAEFFNLGRTAEIDSISVVERMSKDVSVARMAEHFGYLCDRAADMDWTVHLEFMPFSPRIPDLSTAWEIVRRADRDNGGIVFDTWHYCQGESNDELLRQIPGEEIFRVQISDGVPADNDLRTEALHNRRFPGEGEFDLPRVLGILDDIGALKSPGIEAITDETATMTPAEVGEKAMRTLDSVMTRV